MPATVSYYVVIVGVLAAVLLAKEAFGGYGAYPFHPAAVGYAVVAVSWPEQVFAYPQPNLFASLPLGSTKGVALVEGPSHILRNGGLPTISTMDLALGNYAGPMGATMLLVILACALFLLHRRRIGVAAPLCFVGACLLVAFLFPRLGDVAWSMPWSHLAERLAAAKYEVGSGGILYAAVFLINDPATLPKNKVSRAVYGLVLGVVAMMFRYFGTYDNSVCFAVLGVNALTGFLDRLFASRRQGKGGAAR